MIIMQQFKIGDKKIGNGNPCYIIAEAGLNHDGSVEQAKDLVRSAKSAGADMVKFQIYETLELCSRSSKSYNLFSGLELKEEQWKEVAAEAKHAGIEFSASVFGTRSAEILDSIGTNCYKIASGDLTYIQLLSHVARSGKPIILSAGMSYLGEVESAVNMIRSNGNDQIALLHCVSNYPTQASDANLRSMETMRTVFGVPVGFSDHTMDSVVPVAAVAMGANIIEKHFTLSKDLPGPDHKLSMVPAEFRKMIDQIRIVEQAFGDGVKRPVQKEMPVRLSSRRSVVSQRDIEQGDIIDQDSVRIARPGTGIGPEMLGLVIGRPARKRIRAETPLTWDDL
jgi:N-acetylneuraminate synthase/N,N'-diacetyllegionaminate synthase